MFFDADVTLMLHQVDQNCWEIQSSIVVIIMKSFKVPTYIVFIKQSTFINMQRSAAVFMQSTKALLKQPARKKIS